MSNSYNDNYHIFYPQYDNSNYSESRSVIIAWNWLIESCDNYNILDYEHKLRALLSTTSRKTHNIAYMIKNVHSMRKINPNCAEYIKSICCFAKLSLLIDEFQNYQLIN